MSLDESVYRRQPQQQRSQQRIEKILEAAAAVFWEVGYEVATTHAIARRAKTAVGTLYRFFPNKLAIFHELEKRHRQGVEATHTQMMTPEFMQQSLPAMIQTMVETYANYFENVGHRVVYVQYYLSPELFVHFDDTVDGGFIKRLAGMLRLHNASLSLEKSELLAEVCHRSFNAILLSALRSEPIHRAQLYQELQTLLICYLEPHMSDHLSPERPDAKVERISVIAQECGLSDRQQLALAHIFKTGSLTIQVFEALCPERSRRTLQRDLKQLLIQGLLRSEGDTTQLTYYLSDAV